MIRFTASGDALMVNRFPEGYEDYSEISEYVKKGDVRLTNLETTITDLDSYGSAYSGGTWVTAEEDVLKDLKEMGFNYFGIANNHTMDYSYEGLRKTIEYLKKNDIVFAGAGENLKEADAPALIKAGSENIKIISVCSTFNMAAKAGYETPFLPGRPGLNFLRFNTVYEVHRSDIESLKKIGDEVFVNGLKELHRAQGFETKLPEGTYEFGGNLFREVPDSMPKRRTTNCNSTDLKRILETVEKASKDSICIVQIHSHEVKGNNDEEADYFIEEFARKCIENGAKAVVGGGTHQLKGIELYKGYPIFYSLGNFVFQNAKVKKLPSDFMEKYGLGLDATAEEAIRKRASTATADLAKSTPCFRSVIPYFEIEDGKLISLEMKVIELGQNLDWPYKNIPHTAKESVCKEVYEYMKKVSLQYNTEFELDNDIIKVKLEK